MDIKTIIILILSSLLSAAMGYMYSMRQRKARAFPGINGGEKKMKMGEKKMKKMKKDDKKIKGVDAAQGEPAVVQSGVAQYVIENGL
jgi:hypothetical protein